MYGAFVLLLDHQMIGYVDAQRINLGASRQSSTARHVADRERSGAASQWNRPYDFQVRSLITQADIIGALFTRFRVHRNQPCVVSLVEVLEIPVRLAHELDSALLSRMYHLMCRCCESTLCVDAENLLRFVCATRP